MRKIMAIAFASNINEVYRSITYLTSIASSVNRIKATIA